MRTSLGMALTSVGLEQDNRETAYQARKMPGSNPQILLNLILSKLALSELASSQLTNRNGDLSSFAGYPRVLVEDSCPSYPIDERVDEDVHYRRSAIAAAASGVTA